MSSCKKADEVADATATANPNLSLNVPILRVENGMLVFKNGVEYYKGAEMLNTASIQALAKWNKSIGFRSPKQIFNEVVAAEYAIFDPALEKAGKPRPTAHSAAYTNALASGVLKIDPQGDWADRYSYSIHPFYAATVNENGFVCVGTDLLQYTPTHYKIMQNATPADADILAQSKNSNAALGIKVTRRKPNGFAFRDTEESTDKADVRLDYSACWGGNGAISSNGTKSVMIWEVSESEFVDRRNNSNQSIGLYSLRTNGFVIMESKCLSWGSWILQPDDMWVHAQWYAKMPWSGMAGVGTGVYKVNVDVTGNGAGSNNSNLVASFSPAFGGNLGSNPSSTYYINQNWYGSLWLANDDIRPSQFVANATVFPYPKAIRPTANTNGVVGGGNINWLYCRNSLQSAQNSGYYVDARVSCPN